MVRWGIIGCGGIAHNMARAFDLVEEAKLTAVAARDIERAKDFAARYGAERAYGSYAELAADPEIDAVYVATIHPAHRGAVELCLNAGKPVLCEKPMGMNADEDRAMFALAEEKGLLLMEAIWARFLPAWRKAIELVRSGTIGQVKMVFTDFSGRCGYNEDSRLFNMEKGGGSLLDIGVYALHAATYVLGEEVCSVQAAGRLYPTGADAYAAVTLQYPNGAVAVATTGMDCYGGTGDARIMGEEGWIRVAHIMDAHECALHRDGQPEEIFRYEHKNGFVYEVEEFHRLLKEGKTASEIAAPSATVKVAEIIDEALAQIDRVNGYTGRRK